jgi:hypothetical protein
MNKKYILKFAITIIAIFTMISIPYLSSIATFPSNTANNRTALPISINIEADNPLDDTDIELLNCYILKPEEFDIMHFRDVGKNLGLNEEIEFIDTKAFPNTFEIKTENGKLRYHINTGAWTYFSKDAFATVTEQPNLPSDEKSVEIAIDYLKENGLWSEQLEFSHIDKSYQRKKDKYTDEIYEEFIIKKKVKFNRNIDGFILSGAGNKCSVSIGHNSKIVQFMMPKQTFQKTDIEFSFIQPEQALENFKYGRGIKSIPRRNFMNENLTITEINLCYHIDSVTQKNGIINPCYQLIGYLSEGKDVKIHTDAIEIIQ